MKYRDPKKKQKQNKKKNNTTTRKFCSFNIYIYIFIYKNKLIL